MIDLETATEFRLDCLLRDIDQDLKFALLDSDMVQYRALMARRIIVDQHWRRAFAKANNAPIPALAYDPEHALELYRAR